MQTVMVCIIMSDGLKTLIAAYTMLDMNNKITCLQR